MGAHPFESTDDDVVDADAFSCTYNVNSIL